MRCVLMLISGVLAASPLNAHECSDGWYVTGYFLPYEGDYDGPTTTITADDTSLTVPTDFLETIKIEGMGKTVDGRYVGYWDDAWHLAKGVYGDRDNLLSTGINHTSIAVDPNVIPAGTIVTIPTLPHGYAERTYVADDVGPAIVGKSIDVFTGFGREAEQMTYAITSTDNTVCTE